MKNVCLSIGDYHLIMKITNPFSDERVHRRPIISRNWGNSYAPYVYITHKPYIYILPITVLIYPYLGTISKDFARCSSLSLRWCHINVTTHPTTGNSDIMTSLFQKYWSFVRGIWSPIDSPHNGSVMCFDVSFLLSWTSYWITIRVEVGLRRDDALKNFM